MRGPGGGVGGKIKGDPRPDNTHRMRRGGNRRNPMDLTPNNLVVAPPSRSSKGFSGLGQVRGHWTRIGMGEGRSISFISR